MTNSMHFMKQYQMCIEKYLQLIIIPVIILGEQQAGVLFIIQKKQIIIYIFYKQ